MAGKPLRDVEVAIYGSPVGGGSVRFEVKTGADGTYSQRVPEGVFGVSATLQVRFNEENYRFILPSRDGKTAQEFVTSDGLVKDFQWKIFGLKPGQIAGKPGTHSEGNKYFGGYVHLTSYETAKGFETVTYFPKDSELEVVLTPRGKLIDGSTGEPKRFRLRFDKDWTRALDWYLTDIPVGLYTLDARLTAPGGAAVPLKVKQSLAPFAAPYEPQVNVDFQPTQFGDLQMMQIRLFPSVGEAK